MTKSIVSWKFWKPNLAVFQAMFYKNVTIATKHSLPDATTIFVLKEIKKTTKASPLLGSTPTHAIQHIIY